MPSEPFYSDVPEPEAGILAVIKGPEDDPPPGGLDVGALDVDGCRSCCS